MFNLLISIEYLRVYLLLNIVIIYLLIFILVGMGFGEFLCKKKYLIIIDCLIIIDLNIVFLNEVFFFVFILSVVYVLFF